MRKAAAIVLLIAVLFSFAACASAEKTAMGFSMGSDYSVTYAYSGDLNDEIADLLSSIEESFSTRFKSSVISRINDADADASISLSEEDKAVLSRIFEISRETGRAFNPAILPLVQAWGFDPPYEMNDEMPPTAGAIARAKEALSCTFTLDPSTSTILKSDRAGQLDLGAAVKGYAASALADLLKAKGVKEALVYVGGTIAAVGRDYEIGVTPPRASEEAFALRFTLKAGEVCATSGDYERYYVYEGKRYHHILDGSSGYPADSGIISATIISEEGLLADALATAAVVLGAEKSLPLLEKFGAKGILITSEKKVILCGVSATIKDKSYEIA